MISPTPNYDLAILGGGPVGSTLALLLAHTAAQPARIALLRSPRPPTCGADPRSIALNHGSLTLLAALGAAPAQAAEIHTIHVSQRGRFGRTLIRREDFGVPMLGRVARYDAIQTTLDAALATSGVTVLESPAACIRSQTDRLVTLSHHGKPLRAAVAVSADGAPRADWRRDYDQHAVLATVAASQPRAAWAWERFTDEGPLALLPHPDGENHYALVWCCAPARAHALAAMSEGDFARALQAAFGERLGTMCCTSARAVAPLALVARAHAVDGRCVAIGNAAQTLHPVAGQGLNLGLRDAARLAIALSPWLTTTPTADPGPALAEFAQARRADRALTLAITDLLPRAFASGCAPLRHAGGLALLSLDVCAGLRAPLAHHLLQGLRG